VIKGVSIFIKTIKKIIERFIIFLQSSPTYRKSINKILYKHIKYRQVFTSWDKIAFLSFYNPKIGFEKEQLQDMPSQSSSVSHSFIALFLGKIIGGVTLANVNDGNDYLGWWIYSLYVYWPFRRFGVGERLIRKLFDFTQENKIKSLYLSV
jgi:GNAT superfamily N-acetyltransferase